MALDLGELVGSLRLDISPFENSADQADTKAGTTAASVRGKLDGIKGDIKVNVNVETDIDKAKAKVSEFKTQAKADLGEMGVSVGGLLTKAGMAGPAIMAVGSALSAVAAGGTAVVAAVGPAAAAGLMVYAGGMVAIKIATKATSFAMEGLKEAAGGDEEAFAKLTPAGQALALQLQALKPELEGIRTEVQKGLFPGLDVALETLAQDYLPMVKTAAGETGVVLGGLAADGAKLADSPAFKSSFKDILDGNASTLDSMGGAGLSLADAAITLFASAQPLINMFFKWAEGVAAGIADTTRAADESGRLADFWDMAARRGAILGDILGNVGGALGNVFSIGAADGAGGQMLRTLRQGSEEFEKWTESAAGVEAISGWFQQGSDNLGAMWRLVKAVGGGLTDIGAGAQFAPLIDQITNEVIPPLMEFLGNASASGALGKLVTAVGNIIEVFAELSANDKSLYAFADTLNFFAEAAGFIVQNVPGASSVLGIFFTAVGVGSAMKLVGLGGLLNLVGAGLGLLTTKLLIAAGAQTTETGAVTLGTLARQIQMSTIGTWVGVKAIEAAAWIKTAAIATASGIKTAAAWLIAMGPIVLVIAAVAGVAFLIYKYWDEIKEYTGKAWTWVVDQVKKVPALLLGFFLNFTLPGLIIKHWDDIKEGVKDKGGQMLDWVKAVPGKVLGFFVGAGGLLKEKGKDIMEGLKDGASDKWNAVKDWVANVPERFTNTVGGVGSLLKEKGREILQSLKDGASDRWDAVVGWVQGIPDRFVNNVGGVVNLLSEKGREIIASLKAGAEDKWTNLIEWVVGIGDRVKNNVGDLGGLLKSAGIAIIQGLIDGITEKFESLKGKVGAITQWVKDNKGPKSYDLMLWRGPGNWIMEGLMHGLDDQMPALAGKVGEVTDSIAGAPMPSLMASVAPRIPESAEVAGWGARQAGAAGAYQPIFQITETTNPQATAAEVSRRQALAGAGA